ncbi:MAG: hypothetical protein SR3Q1_00395 [Quinella sp. 3Q1]|nr:hypothetical protein [Quinella sp. 3Q1]MBR6888550.1 hypothetical protein [Selenomonadaceae bacterium]
MDGEKRYCTIEESLIEACKEVNLMRKGLLPSSGDWREWLDELKKEIEDTEFIHQNFQGA